jgi:hypothetical protein
MVGTSTRFASEKAPCGKTVEGRRHRDDDDEGFVIDDLYYDCGCRTVRHAYHDGSVSTRVVRHDGRVLADDHSAEHGN